MDHDELPKKQTIQSWKSLGLLPCSGEIEKLNPDKASALYLEAIEQNPGSFKLWHAFLLHITRQLEGKHIDDLAFTRVERHFEEALVFMHRMPRIWIEYCTLLDRQLFVTKTRRSFDRALEALPITQHARIWPLYIDFIKKDHVPTETAIRVFKRYMQFKPEEAELYIDYLYLKNRIDEASILLCDIINRPQFQSKRDKTKYQLWEELCDMICEFAEQIETIDAEAVLRDGIARYQDQQGKLWNSLARYYIQMGLFTSARNIYDEAINHVTTKKDFVEVWEAYTNFEEKYLEHLLTDDNPSKEKLIDIEMRQSLLENLITNNDLLLNRVALRQNPHNVREWQKRVQLSEQVECSDSAKEEVYVEAIQKIDPKQALGEYEDIWIEYATFHADADRVESSRDVFDRAVEAKFPKIEQLAKVWSSYIEFELQTCHDRALKLAKRSTASIKSLQLWSLYADMEENFGNFESTKAVYDRILDLKIATPQLVLNYASLMEEKNYFEESFRVYERGVSLFRWPISACIWTTYLNKFLTRYGYKKLDRLRDLLEQCLNDCPADLSCNIYILYAKIEEEAGLILRAREVYSRAALRVSPRDKPMIFKVYLRSMAKIVDINTMRSIYEQAISGLDNANARNFCLEYASFEELLNEIERARTIYSYCCDLCDPRSDTEAWKLWADFEQRHGNLDSIDGMLRVKRSVELRFASTS